MIFNMPSRTLRMADNVSSKEEVPRLRERFCECAASVLFSKEEPGILCLEEALFACTFSSGPVFVLFYLPHESASHLLESRGWNLMHTILGSIQLSVG